MAREWWQKTVFYQIYPRSFCDSNGDGIGDIPGIISKLDYLQDLGIGAIWLSPVYKSPNHDNGYDISDYYDINPEYGTLDDMKRLFAEAKRRDIRILMDLVINHTSDEHPWFVAAQNPDSPYRDYYIWRDTKKKNTRRPPNNWLSYFGGSAWQWHESSGQYYLHLFSRHQPDLNFRNPAVIEEVKTIMRFWLDLGAVGFRCDAINMIYKTSFGEGHHSLFHLPGSHHYFSQEGNHAVLQELHRDVLEPYAAFTVGEMAGGVDAATAKRFVTGELDAVFTFDHLTVDEWGMPFVARRYRPERLKRALTAWQQALPWNALFFENHDTGRSLNKFRLIGPYTTQGATMLATLLLTLRGIPFVYQGEEIGMENYPFTSIDEVQDPAAHGVYGTLRRYHVPKRLAFRFAMKVCRDHTRTLMQWDASRNAGFTTGIPWRPVHPNFKEVNVSAEKSDKGSVYEYYRSLLYLRNTTPALQDGTCTILPSAKDVFMYRREKNGEQYTILINMSPRRRRYHLSLDGECVLSNYPGGDRSQRLLCPYEVMIYKTAVRSK
jgi:oligo-1,6-glucosidase